MQSNLKKFEEIWRFILLRRTLFRRWARRQNLNAVVWGLSTCKFHLWDPICCLTLKPARKQTKALLDSGADSLLSTGRRRNPPFQSMNKHPEAIEMLKTALSRSFYSRHSYSLSQPRIFVQPKFQWNKSSANPRGNFVCLNFVISRLKNKIISIALADTCM